MNEKIHNLIKDPNVTFFLHSTPLIREMIALDEHPIIKELNPHTKADMLSGKVMILDKEDVLNFVLGKMPEREAFVLRTAEIRVVGEPAIKVGENKGT